MVSDHEPTKTVSRRRITYSNLPVRNSCPQESLWSPTVFRHVCVCTGDVIGLRLGTRREGRGRDMDEGQEAEDFLYRYVRDRKGRTTSTQM